MEMVFKRQIPWNCLEVLLRAVMPRKVLREEKTWIKSSGARYNGGRGAALPDIWLGGCGVRSSRRSLSWRGNVNVRM